MSFVIPDTYLSISLFWIWFGAVRFGFSRPFLPTVDSRSDHTLGRPLHIPEYALGDTQKTQTVTFVHDCCPVVADEMSPKHANHSLPGKNAMRTGEVRFVADPRKHFFRLRTSAHWLST